MKLDLLAFGVHPDDIELSCAGTILVEKQNGKKVGIIDLTKGELGTRGDAKTRKEEAENSAVILGVDIRENLEMADGFFKNDEENQVKIIKVLRKYRPEIILCNAPEDRHPDHERSAALVNDATFLSGLKKIETKDEKGNLQEVWRPKYVLNYIQDTYLSPAFVIDISGVFDKKIEAIEAFSTQFYNPEASDKEPQTYISSPEFLESVINRSKMFGKMIGVKYAEGFLTKKMIGIKSFDALIQKST
ncbi:MAG: bacillithiol biosynthesis deacetylase BshB1 [Ginsengibacter sp.]